MAYAILRTAKLKTAGNIGGSLSHNYRTRETPNAVDERTHLNVHSLPTAELVKSAIEDRLPEKVRSNGVLCIEYFIGASPEYFDQGDADGSRYFETAKKWLEDKHGKENVVATSIHYDETSPHLVAYVVPIDQDTGKLNARKFLGGRATLSAMQTDFAQTVKHHGLDRGVEGSKATHTTIQEYYSMINRTEPNPELTIPEPKGMFSGESKSAYGERVAETIHQQMEPKFKELGAKANQAELALKEAKEAKETVKAWQENFAPAWEVISPLDKEQRKEFLAIMKVESDKMIGEKERKKQEEIEAKNARIAHKKRQRSFSGLAKKKPKGQSL